MKENCFIVLDNYAKWSSASVRAQYIQAVLLSHTCNNDFAVQVICFGDTERGFRIFFCLFVLILYVPVNNFSVIFWDGSSWVGPVLSKDKCVLLKDTTQ